MMGKTLAGMFGVSAIVLGGLLTGACDDNNKLNAVKTTANDVGDDIREGVQTITSDESTPTMTPLTPEGTPTPY
jgi:hypothetical protein